jgi:hypothetical protein
MGHEEAGAIHGHDLALGSGSVDGVLGARLSATRSRAFLDLAAQYALRTEGDFDYRFGDDLQASLSAGAYPLLGHDRTFALGAHLSIERKSSDRVAGEPLDDTRIESVFAGPLARFTQGESWHVELALDLPVSIDNGGTQIVPDLRARVGLIHRF